MQNIQQLLQGLGAQSVNMGGMQGMAVDGMQFLKLLQQLQEQVGALAAENADLKAALEQQGYTQPVQLPTTPQYPDSFFSYGTSPYAYVPTDVEVQDLIDSLADIELEDGQFEEATAGTVIVIKTKSDGIYKYIVANGYSEATEEDTEQNELERCDCGNCQTGYGF